MEVRVLGIWFFSQKGWHAPELYTVLTRKRIFSATKSQAIISGLASLTVTVEIDTPKVLKAMEINIHYGYSATSQKVLVAHEL
jgi:hypothetical protein